MIVRFLTPMVVSLALLNGPANVYVHERGHHGNSTDAKASRTWTIASEGADLHGSFVAASGNQVQLRRDDGELTTFAIDRLVGSDQAWIDARLREIKRLNRQQGIQLVAQNHSHRAAAGAKSNDTPMPLIGEHFNPFAQKLQLRSDHDYFYVGSNGLPDHPMMIGIRAWQQQVPIPQSYFGNNAWRIPLHPQPAKQPLSTKNDFLRGAIALAVNGVPIFNPLNNRGDDAFLFGELDEYGGHCGRADDYHYHLAPVHLEEITGKGNPIAYALDGYPILGYQDEKATDFAPLDKLGGHKDASGEYHYHATKTYPYLNGGFYGEVTKRGGQVDPQPRAEPLRPALEPLRDATITGFSKTDNRFQLNYDLSGRKGVITHVIKNDGSVNFTYQEPSGKTRTESYRRRRGETYVPLSSVLCSSSFGSSAFGSSALGSNADANANESPATDLPRLIVTSPAFAAGDEMPIEFTGDGSGESPPVAWTKGPAGTQCYALNLWHTPGPGDVKSYWLLYDIPADVTSLPQDARGIGIAGYND